MFKQAPKFPFDNSFQTLPKVLFEHVEPTPIANPKLIAISENCLRLLGSEISNLSGPALCKWLNGEDHLKGEQRISTRYAGHQFGQWAGQLGDGRAISVGEIINESGARWEIQTKGSGLTPFSRMGDGKAVIRSSVREFVASEAMAALRIPTTRALALITGNDEVYRETVERSALVARVFPTNIRFGHFELCFHFGQKDALEELIHYTRKNFFNNVSIEEMLRRIVVSTASLIAKWQAVGFCHGVMNTDNMSILGLTMDYGPYGFMEDTQLNFICNHSDDRGRYAYFRQPGIALWNLEKLLVCFIPFVPKEKLEEILSLYIDQYTEFWVEEFCRKLGIKRNHDRPIDDYEEFFSAGLKCLHDLQIDFTFFFRQLANYRKGEVDSLKALWTKYSPNNDLTTWFKTYDVFLEESHSEERDRRSKMNLVNPKFVLKNYIAQEIIEDVEKDSSKRLEEWMQVLTNPFDEHPDFESYASPTPMDKKNIEVSCSS